MYGRLFDGQAGLEARFSETLASLDGDCPQAWRLCEAMRQITGAAGVVATIEYLSDVRTTLCATDDIALVIDSLQEFVGEGPGFDAAASGQMVASYLGDVHESRWPHFLRALWDELRDITVFATSMGGTARLTGVVTLYVPQRQSLRISGDGVVFLARTIGAALLADGREQARSAEGLMGPWTSRGVVHQATGMVMAQLDIPSDDALSLLRSRAYADGADLAVVARQVVDRSLSFANAPADGD